MEFILREVGGMGFWILFCLGKIYDRSLGIQGHSVMIQERQDLRWRLYVAMPH